MAASPSCRLQHGLGPNNAFKPKPLRYAKHMAGTACHVLRFTTRLGLTWVLGRAGQAPMTVLVSATESFRRKLRAPELCAASSFPIVRGAIRWLTELCAAGDFPQVRGASLPSPRLGVQSRQAGHWRHRLRPNNSFKPMPLRGTA
jgi:hypothetical protein